MRVHDQEGNGVEFKLKKHTLLKKLMDAFAARRSARSINFWFMYGGKRLDETDTAGLRKKDDGDYIDALLQLGVPHTGSVVPLKLESKSSALALPWQLPEADNQSIHLKVRVPDSRLLFEIKKRTPLKKLMDAFAGRRGNNFLFIVGGRCLNETDTVGRMKLGDCDCIDALLRPGTPI